MAKRQPPRGLSYVLIHGEPVLVSEMLEDGTIRDSNELTPEEREFVQKRLRYRYVQGLIDIYAQKGYRLVPEEEYLQTPVEPVGRFAEPGALD